MKRIVLGLALTFTGVLMDAALVVASAILYAGGRFSGNGFWYLLYSLPGADPNVTGPGFVIPLIAFSALAVLGLLLILSGPRDRKH